MNKPLPSARLVSTNIHNDVSASHVRYTMMIMQWGQITDHDVIFTPVNKGTSFPHVNIINSLLILMILIEQIFISPTILEIN